MHHMLLSHAELPARVFYRLAEVCRWGQAQTPNLTLPSTVAWRQIASKKLNDHEFVEDWLARWKEATVAEVLASWFISAFV